MCIGRLGPRPNGLHTKHGALDSTGRNRNRRPCDKVGIRTASAGSQGPLRASQQDGPGPGGRKLRRARVIATALSWFVVSWGTASAQQAAPLPQSQTGVMEAAEVQPPYTLGASYEYLWDSNVFRLPTGAPVEQLVGKSSPSDSAQTVTLDAGGNGHISGQDFGGTVLFTSTHYSTFTNLDLNAFGYNGYLKGILGPDVSYSALASRTEATADFADYRDFKQPDVQTRTNESLKADWLVGGPWHVEGGASDAELNNSQTFQEIGNTRFVSGELGVRYEFNEQDSVTLDGRESRGDILDQPLDPTTLVDTGFRQSDVELKGAWQFSDISTLSLRLDSTERIYDHFHQRNYSGIVGEIADAYHWDDRLQIVIAADHDLQSWITPSASYYSADSIRIAPQYELSPKVLIEAQFVLARRSYFGDVGPPVSTQQDDYRTGALKVTWSPAPYLKVIAQASHESRTSNAIAYGFNVNTVGVTAQFIWY